ncbi:lactococcin 972 family bacteriocin [Streptococcus uberis]|uniref:lactococcin 972 family bacteriocin n=1 Tax=Streptococcus uberis TaxID=1349 RepID=UPI0038B67075
MKKFILGIAVLALSGTTFCKVVLADREPTSGGWTPTQVEQHKADMESRTLQYVGGGTWFAANLGNETVSSYYHRDRKHSATVSSTSGKYHKAVRPAGQEARASLPYVRGANSTYWNNSPQERMGDYRN